MALTRASTFFFWPVISVIALATTPAAAQYMYLDSNANGVHDTGDILNPNGEPTAVDIYLITTLNGDSSAAHCTSDSSTPLDVSGFSINLLATGGLVIYSGFTCPVGGFTTSFGEFNPGDGRYKNGLTTVNPAQALPAGGPHRLATITITAISLTPQVNIVPNVWGVADGTFFGTSCLGADLGNTYILGTDWLDVGGLGTTTSLADGGYPGFFNTSGDGLIYLGGNKIDPPYELKYVSGDLAVNGLVFLPTTSPPSPEPNYTAAELAEINFHQQVGDAADSLRATGMSPEEIRDVLGAMCSRSALIDSIALGPQSLSWRFREGRLAGIELANRMETLPKRSLSELQEIELKHLQTLLDMGATVFLGSRGQRFIVPRGRRAYFESLVWRLRNGEALEGLDKARFPGDLQEQLRAPRVLVRVR